MSSTTTPPTDLPMLDLPLAHSAWMEPALLTSPAPWAGHIPFAAWLMAVARPRTLVELGVYSGISYLAFCQAAVQHGVPLRAFGVDTWAGDAHAGYYGQQILDTLRARHDAAYGSFSTLLQKTFDQALADVPDGSVDLLHIDGLHTYEAVRHDFETWRPKLSPRAVVLFHDIEVRRDDFGVWRFWAEVAPQYPSLAFAHSNGLGVLLVGPDAPAALKALTQAPERWPQRRDAFAALGERFELRAHRLHLDTVVADLAAEKTALADEKQALLAAQAALQTQVQAQHQWIEQQDERLREAERQQQRDAQALGSVQKDLTDARRAQQQAAAEVQDMLASRSWRVTAGLRWAGRQARQLRASRAGAALGMNLKRSRNALRYLLSGNWRALVQRMRHAKQQAVEVQRLGRFDSQPVQTLQCGILATPHTWYVAHALQVALARAGMTVDMVQESPEGHYPLDLYFVVCPQMFKQLPPGEKRVAFQMEQTVSSRWFTPEYLAVLENSLAALDYAQTNLAKLADYGIVYPHVYLTPIGGVADYAHWLGDAVQPDETCDVLFYGDANAPRRRRLLDAVGRHFKLRIVGNLFGADMRRALAGAKVVVNLHYYEGALLETTRLYECLSLGVPVVSECAADQAEHTDLEAVVRFVPVGDEAALLAALSQTLQEQATEEGRRDWQARCRAQVAASQARFEFMLYRMLLARRVIDYTQFAALTHDGPPCAPRMALSLPETTERRQAFEPQRPANVQVFDGLRYAPGWIGCALSYKYLAQKALRQGVSQLEIMEDDVDFPPDYAQRRQRVLAHLARRQGQWDVFVGVMALVHPDTRVLHVEQVEGETYVTLDRMISMVCNIYTRGALERIAGWDETWQDAERNTIDRYLQNQGEMRVLITLPFLVGHREDVASSLWGISNAQYAHLIEDAQAQLEKLVQQFLNERQTKDEQG